MSIPHVSNTFEDLLDPKFQEIFDCGWCPGEVTPEMIKAGIGVFVSFDRRFDSEEETVERIFQTMRDLEPKSSSPLDVDLSVMFEFPPEKKLK